ncbi:MAG: hypothetical protein LBJ74_05935 [Heliobacteriaceae bacterium]|jgi:hypothetical protein|nr:hypothetical protein [Heliobacteriaceae bacterium]
MDNKNYIKSLLSLNGITIKGIADKMREASGLNYTRKSLYGKLNRNTITLAEFQMITDLLGYKIEVVRK